MEDILNNKLNLKNRIKNVFSYYIHFIKVNYNEKSELQKKYNGHKLESISDLMKLVNKTYLKKWIYDEVSKSFFDKITKYEIEEILIYLKKDKFYFKKELSYIRLYLINMNAEHLFDGYYKRLKFYQLLKKKAIKKEKLNFYLNISKIIKEEENV